MWLRGMMSRILENEGVKGSEWMAIIIKIDVVNGIKRVILIIMIVVVNNVV